MSTKLADSVLSQVADFVAVHLGLNFRNRGCDLERGILAVVRDHNQYDITDYIQRLLENGPDSNELDLLAPHLTIGETYFFRDKRVLEILEKRILPELSLLRACTSQLSIWSAGCSTGEEPYSIAMAIARARERLPIPNIKIFATDINRQSLRKASEGKYAEWSFRDTPSWVKSTYFHEAPNHRWSILPSIKTAVTFNCLNLMKDPYFSLSDGISSVDVIFCRNVLMYFTPEAMRRVVCGFHRLLAPNGWLVVSPAETSRDLFAEFTPVALDGATLYRKSNPSLPLVLTNNTSFEERAAVQTPTATITEPSSQHFCEVEYTALEVQSVQRSAPASNEREQQQTEDALVLARTYANEGNRVEALSWCEKALVANKMTPTAHYLKAMILQEQDSQQDAVHALRQAIYVDPKFVLGHFALANLLLRQGKFSQSQKHFENVGLLLAQYKSEDIVPESDGLSAGMLRAMLPPNAPVLHRRPAPLMERTNTR